MLPRKSRGGEQAGGRLSPLKREFATHTAFATAQPLLLVVFRSLCRSVVAVSMCAARENTSPNADYSGALAVIGNEAPSHAMPGGF